MAVGRSSTWKGTVTVDRDASQLDVTGSDEGGFLLCGQGMYTWVGRCAGAVQIHVAGDEEHSHTVVGGSDNGRAGGYHYSRS
jgi:hypothetical protein